MIRFIQFREEGALPGPEYVQGAIDRALEKLNTWNEDLKPKILQLSKDFVPLAPHGKIGVILDVVYDDGQPYVKPGEVKMSEIILSGN